MRFPDALHQRLVAKVARGIERQTWQLQGRPHPRQRHLRPLVVAEEDPDRCPGRLQSRDRADNHARIEDIVDFFVRRNEIAEPVGDRSRRLFTDNDDTIRRIGRGANASTRVAVKRLRHIDDEARRHQE